MRDSAVALVAIGSILILGLVYAFSASPKKEHKEFQKEYIYELPGIPYSPDSIHQWELIGRSEDCVVYYRKHLHVRIYWSLCNDGSSSISVE